MSIVLPVPAFSKTGVRHVRHIGYLDTDPLVKRFCGLRQVPTVPPLGRWLRALEYGRVDTLLALNEVLVGRVINGSAVRRLTLVVDGSVVWISLQVAGARRGYNRRRRKVPSYYPITA